MGSRSKIDLLWEVNDLFQLIKVKRRNPAHLRVHFKFERPPKILVCPTPHTNKHKRCKRARIKNRGKNDKKERTGIYRSS